MERISQRHTADDSARPRAGSRATDRLGELRMRLVDAVVAARRGQRASSDLRPDLERFVRALLHLDLAPRMVEHAVTQAVHSSDHFMQGGGAPPERDALVALLTRWCREELDPSLD